MHLLQEAHTISAVVEALELLLKVLTECLLIAVVETCDREKPFNGALLKDLLLVSVEGLRLAQDVEQHEHEKGLWV